MLSDVIRAALQGRQVPLEGQDHYIQKLGDLRRYQSAINAFWQQCISVSPDPFRLSLDAIASQLLLLHDKSPSQARSAFSALLLVPGLEHLRFSSLLKVCKRQWSASQPKYSVFWSAGRVVKMLAQQRLNWDSVEQVRDRLILCWRLFGLHRSIDLARLDRKVSFVNRRPFVVIHRKGWPAPRWEEVLCFSDRSLSPWHLLQRYVFLTSQVPKGCLVLRALKASFEPLTSDRIDSLTRTLLKKLGVPTGFSGPHSTGGAGVQFWKELGLSSEEVCHIGQWKNSEAFAKHYLRVGAHSLASEKVKGFVHRVSQGLEAELEGSPTPQTEERGGCDPDSEAQRHCEPTHPPRGRSKEKSQAKKHPPRERGNAPERFTFAAQRTSSSPSLQSTNQDRGEGQGH